jgi:tetratricopeptide (TPR) repeat protein
MTNNPRRCATRRVWIFRLLALAISLAPFLLLETGLRAIDFGDDTRLVVRAPYAASPTTFHFNPPADRAYYGPQDLAGPDPRHFQIPKPPATYRIVVIGGSTVAGFPYPFELAMPRHLEVILQQQLPDRKFEVLNAGITAINSFSEVDVMRQVVACDPDLIVVHSGHNEFYGPGGSASNASSLAPGLYPFMQAVRRQRTFQLVVSLIPRPQNSQILETLPADTAIPLDSDVVRRTGARYRSNLEKLVAIAERARIPLVVSSVPSKLRNFVPLQAVSDSSLTPSQQAAQESKFNEAKRLISYGKYQPALTTLQEARHVDPNNALLVYREAQCLEALERRDEAFSAYALAADLDGCRMRAPRSFAIIVREVADEATKHAHFCDVAGRLPAESEFAAPGSDLFLEHVHYNLEGNWRVARILGECIVEKVLGVDWQPERFPENERRDKLLGVTPFDPLVADVIIGLMYDVTPFNLSPSRAEDAAEVKDRVGARYAELTQLDKDCFLTLQMEAMEQDVLIGMGFAYRAAGQVELALTTFQQDIFRRPWWPAGYVGAVETLTALGRNDEAQQLLDQVLGLAPQDPRVQELQE